MDKADQKVADARREVRSFVVESAREEHRVAGGNRERRRGPRVGKREARPSSGELTQLVELHHEAYVENKAYMTGQRGPSG